MREIVLKNVWEYYNLLKIFNLNLVKLILKNKYNRLFIYLTFCTVRFVTRCHRPTALPGHHK